MHYGFRKREIPTEKQHTNNFIVIESEYKPSTRDGMDLSLSELENRISSLLMKSL